MTRTNRKHNRQIERHRRNKGPELLCKAADNELQDKAGAMAARLSKATIEEGSVAAVGLLLTLADQGNENENPGAVAPISMAEQWSKEPSYEDPDTMPRLVAPPVRRALTDGSVQEGERPKAEPDGILEGEYEMLGPPAAEAKP